VNKIEKKLVGTKAKGKGRDNSVGLPLDILGRRKLGGVNCPGVIRH